MICLGLDPGTSNPGLAVVERSARSWHLLHLPVLHSFDELLAELALVGQRWDIRCASFEEVAWSVQGKHQGGAVHQNASSGGVLMAVGAVRLFAAFRRIPCIGVHPNSWRKAITGSGKATKEQARLAVRQQIATGWPNGTVGLNRSDACCVAIAGPRTAGPDVVRRLVA